MQTQLKLNKREKELLGYLAQGLANKEIAVKMCISETMVKRLFYLLREKMECKNRTALVVQAIKANLIQINA